MKILVCHDSSPYYKAVGVMAKIHEMKIVSHTHYAPDLAPSDFFPKKISCIFAIVSFHPHMRNDNIQL